MKLNKLLLTAGVLAVFAAPVMAQDFGDFGDFGDSFGGDDASGFGSSSSKVEVSGNVSLEARAYVDTDNSDKNKDKDTDEKIEVTGKPSGKLDLTYSGNNSDMILSLSMDADKIKANPEDIIDELTIRGRLGDNLTVEAGKMKVVWGKGDKLHVLDNFNADNYTDFIIPDYLDRRVSTPMLRAVVSLPVANLNVEGIYTPLLPTDRFATSGRWTPAQVTALTSTVTSAATKKVGDAFTAYTTASATAGTLKALYAEYQAAQTAYDTAMLTALATQRVEAQLGTAWSSMTDEQKNAAVANAIATNKAALEAGVAANRTALETGLSSAGKGYFKDNLSETKGAYDAACKKSGYTAENIDAALKSAGTSYMHSLTYANSLSADPTVIYPNMWTLKYGQFGGRATWTLGQVDMGISYYNGWYKQPSVNGEKLNTFVEKWLANGSVSEADKFLAYDKKQTFGVEASSIIWHFNVRGEFAYNLTDDTDGTNPWVHNNSIGWLGGFDIDLPFANANLNVQEIGTLILHGDECDKNWNDNKKKDVDYGVNGYTNNKIAANLTTSFMNDKVAPEVTVMYGIENKDLVVMPKLTYKADQNLSLIASGMVINCGDDNSEFKAWEKNSFVSVGAKYQF